MLTWLCRISFKPDQELIAAGFGVLSHSYKDHPLENRL
jgi:hypothetical protein